MPNLTEKQRLIVVGLLENDEGFRSIAYDDATGEPVKAPQGNLTIGIGRNLQDYKITHHEAIYLCLNNIRNCENVLGDLLFFNFLDFPRKYVLINVCFNVGLSGIMRFKKMLKAMHNRDWQEAAKELLDSNAARKLSNRYDQLAKIMISGALK